MFKNCPKPLIEILRCVRRVAANGSGLAEGRDLEAKSFNLAQMPNRSTND